MVEKDIANESGGAQDTTATPESVVAAPIGANNDYQAIPAEVFLPEPDDKQYGAIPVEVKQTGGAYGTIPQGVSESDAGEGGEAKKSAAYGTIPQGVLNQSGAALNQSAASTALLDSVLADVESVVGKRSLPVAKPDTPYGAFPTSLMTKDAPLPAPIADVPAPPAAATAVVTTTSPRADDAVESESAAPPQQESAYGNIPADLKHAAEPTPVEASPPVAVVTSPVATGTPYYLTRFNILISTIDESRKAIFDELDALAELDDDPASR